MGTNYYARIIPKKERKDYFKKLIDEESSDRYEIRNIFEELFGQFNLENPDGCIVHLGKKSYGWKFLFNPNQYKQITKSHFDKSSNKLIIDEFKLINKYELTKKSITDFIFRPDVILYNEYDEKVEKDKFIQMVKDSYNNKDNYDITSFELKNKCNSNYRNEESGEYWKSLGYNVQPTDSEFYSDGLRFATFMEFS